MPILTDFEVEDLLLASSNGSENPAFLTDPTVETRTGRTTHNYSIESYYPRYDEDSIGCGLAPRRPIQDSLRRHRDISLVGLLILFGMISV